MKKLRKSTRRKAKKPELTLTPLIDTFSVLLIIFIMAAPMVHNGIRVDLPHGKTLETGTEQELVVTLSKDDKLYFNSYPMKRQELTNSVRKALVQKEDTPVFIRADETVAYGKVIEVVDELKQAGVRYVAMSTRPS